MLRGTIEPAVAQLHSAIDFASFGGGDDGPDVDAITEEANGAATLSSEGAPEGFVKVELSTKAGVASVNVPKESFASDDLGSSSLNLDAFLDALVAGAMGKHDADGNGTIESDEFITFASENAFLSAWFGHLTARARPEGLDV